MGMPYAVLMPIFAKDMLHGEAHTFGFLMAASGGGALASTIYLASRTSVLGLGRLISAAGVIFGAGIAGFALSRSLVLSLVFLAFAGFGGMALIASSNTILQTIVDDDKRGRVMSFFTMSFMGATPLGSLLAGAAAHQVGVRATLFAGGSACLVGGLLFALNLKSLRAAIRPIYVRMGIMPEVAIGMQTASELTVPPEEQ